MNEVISEALNFGIKQVLANMDYNKEGNNDNRSMSSRLSICLNVQVSMRKRMKKCQESPF